MSEADLQKVIPDWSYIQPTVAAWNTAGITGGLYNTTPSTFTMCSAQPGMTFSANQLMLIRKQDANDEADMIVTNATTPQDITALGMQLLGEDANEED